MQRRLAPLGRPLALTPHPMATPKPGGRRQNRGVRPPVQGMHESPRQTERHGGRRMGHFVFGSGKQTLIRRVSQKSSFNSQNVEGQSSGLAWQSGD